MAGKALLQAHNGLEKIVDLVLLDTVVDRWVVLSVFYRVLDKVAAQAPLGSLVSNAEMVEAQLFEWHLDMAGSCSPGDQEVTTDIHALRLS